MIVPPSQQKEDSSEASARASRLALACSQIRTDLRKERRRPRGEEFPLIKRLLVLLLLLCEYHLGSI